MHRSPLKNKSTLKDMKDKVSTCNAATTKSSPTAANATNMSSAVPRDLDRCKVSDEAEVRRLASIDVVSGAYWWAQA